MLGWLVDRKIAPHIPVMEKRAARTGPGAAQTSKGTYKTTNMFVQKANHSSSSAATILTPTEARAAKASPKPNNISSRCGSERRWKCSLPTSNAFSGWGDSDYEVPAAQMTNSSSLPPPKTSANEPRSFLHRSKRAKPDGKGARALFKTRIPASATRCFSTEPATCGFSAFNRIATQTRLQPAPQAVTLPATTLQKGHHT